MKTYLNLFFTSLLLATITSCSYKNEEIKFSYSLTGVTYISVSHKNKTFVPKSRLHASQQKNISINRSEIKEYARINEFNRKDTIWENIYNGKTYVPYAKSLYDTKISIDSITSIDKLSYQIKGHAISNILVDKKETLSKYSVKNEFTDTLNIQINKRRLSDYIVNYITTNQLQHKINKHILKTDLETKAYR